MTFSDQKNLEIARNGDRIVKKLFYTNLMGKKIVVDQMKCLVSCEIGVPTF